MGSLTIEIIKNRVCKVNNEKLIQKCEEYLRSNNITPGTTISLFDDVEITENVQNVIVEDCEVDEINFNNVDFKWYIYSLCNLVGQVENIQNDNEVITLSTNWIIPANDFHGLWENLIYDSKIKEDLLKYVSTMMMFSDKGVDPNIVCSNRVVLLHGPPGTGKTTLCKALAQKLAIRLKNRYSYGQFIEINSHSLFSKWFSESGKLVTKMFSKIYDMVENPDMFVCVLIDEVESLAHARNQCIQGNEPSDSIRVVNAILTQIDQIKRYPNVLILTTSNMTEAIDLAFVDRADIKQYIGLPSTYAIYQIYLSCVKELMRKEIIVPECPLLSSKIIQSIKNEQIDCEYSKQLLEICEKSSGFSGRTLRKVPFIAHALFSKNTTLNLPEFLDCMNQAIEYFKTEKEYFK